MENKFECSVFVRNNKANSLFREIYLYGEGFDKTHKYLLYSILRNYEDIGWAVTFKDLNTDENTGWLVFSKSEEVTGYVKATIGHYSIEAVLADWSVIDKTQIIFDNDEAVLSGNQFNLDFSPVIKGIHDAKNYCTNADFTELKQKVNPNLRYTDNTGANEVIQFLYINKDLLTKNDIELYYIRRNLNEQWNIGFRSSSDDSYRITVTSKSEIDILDLSLADGTIVGTVTINWDKVADKKQTLYNAPLLETAYIKPYYLQRIEELASFDDSIEEAVGNIKLASEPYAFNTDAAARNIILTNTDDEHSVFSPANRGILYSSRIGCNYTISSEKYKGETVYFQLKFKVDGINNFTVSNFDIFINDSKAELRNSKVSILEDVVTVSTERTVEEVDSKYNFLMQMKGITNSQTFSEDIKLTYLSDYSYVQRTFSDFIDGVKNEIETIKDSYDSIVDTFKLPYIGYAAMKVIKVKVDGTGDFISIQDAINSITDADVNNQYDIQVYDDIIIDNMSDMWKNKGSQKLSENEYITPPSCAIFFTKDWVHVRGMGAMKKIIFKCPTNVQDAYEQNIQCVFLQGNSSIENFYIEIDRGRYAIHQESGGSKTHIDYNATTICKDLVVRHKGLNNSWGSAIAQANGTTSGLKLIYDNVTWVSDKNTVPYYTHTNRNFDSPNMFVFKSCRMVSGNNTNNSFGSNSQPGIYDLGCGWVNDVYMYSCDFPKFDCRNKIYGIETERGFSDNIDAGGCNIKGNGNNKQLINTPMLSMLHFTTKEIGKSIDVVEGTAYSDIWGETYKKYDGEDIKGYAFGRKRIEVDTSRGEQTSYIYTLAYRLGNCASSNKTLIVNIGGEQRTITFNKNYMTQDGSPFSPTTVPYVSDSEIINDINNAISSYATASIDETLIKAQTFDDCKTIIFNFSESTFEIGDGLIYDYANKMYRLCAGDEQPDVIASECICTGEYGEAIKPDKVLLHRNLFLNSYSSSGSTYFTIRENYGFEDAKLVKKEDGTYKAIRADALIKL